MARRSAHGKKHALKCKFDSQAPGEANDDDDGPVKPGRFGTYGDDIPQFVMDVFGATQDDPNFGLATWLSTFDEPLADMQPYGLAPHSLRVPQGTDHHIFKAFCVPLAMLCMDHEGFESMAIRLHWMMFLMLFCPVYERSLGGNLLSPTAAVKARVDRFLAGEWKCLWADAHSLVQSRRSEPQSERPRSEEEEEDVRVKRATHQALAGQLQDARRTLTDPGLLSSRDTGVRTQFRKLFAYNPDTIEAFPQLPPPDDDDDDPYSHPIDVIYIKQREGPEIETPTLGYIMTHLPKLKAADQFGARYEHYRVMPQALVSGIAQLALDGKLSASIKHHWQSGLLHAGDKQKKTPEGYTAARAIVVGPTIRRITGRIPCMQLRQKFSDTFAKVRALGSAIPAGIEIAYRTAVLAIDHMLAGADEPGDLPLPLQTDFTDGFPRAKRILMIRACMAHVKSLTRYLYTCYDSVGKLWLLDRGEVVESFECADGIWQGDPLGNPCFGLAIYTFMEKVKAHLKPHDSPLRGLNGAPVAWIVDDSIMVPRRRQAIDLLKFIIEHGPAHGLHLNLSKVNAWLVKGDTGSTEVAQQLRDMGAKVSTQGLDRLLGAPIGTQSFMVSAGGHLDKIVEASASLIDKVQQVGHTQAQYLLLRFCTSVAMHHCPRLISPHILRPFADKHRSLIHKAFQHLLHASSPLSHFQRVRVGLPEREGGMACTTSAEVLDSAFIASAGAAGQWYCSCGWPEAERLYVALTALPALRGAVDVMTAMIEDASHRSKQGGKQGMYKLPVLDPDRPDLFPRQNVLSKVVHRLTAQDLLKKATDRRSKSWMLSCSLPASGHWLHAIPTVSYFKASSDVFRTMLCLRLEVPPPVTRSVKRCKCGMTGPSLEYGFHWIGQCRKCSYSTVRHNAAAGVVRDMSRAAGYRVEDGETARWWIGAPKIRSYDIVMKSKDSEDSEWIGVDVGVADPTRHGRLPTGEDHFTRGKAAAMMVHRKKCAYGRLLHTYALRKTVDHKAAGLEVAGGMGTKAAELINTISAEAKDNKVRLKLADWSWSAQSFSAHWLVRLSFTINKLTALGVHHGVRQAMAASAGNN